MILKWSSSKIKIFVELQICREYHLPSSSSSSSSFHLPVFSPHTSLIVPAERLRVGAPAGVHHGFVVLMLLVLGQAGQRVALPERQQLVLGADAARRPVEGGAGVMRLGGKRVRVRGGGGDLDAGPGAVEGQRAPGAQRVLAAPRQVVLRGVEGGRSVVGAPFGVVVVGVLVKFFLWFGKRDTE